MFDFVRRHTKFFMTFLFLLIIPAFVLVGVDGFRNINAAGDAVAQVGKVKILQSEWDAAHRNQVDEMRNSMPNIDVKMLDTPPARYATLERLVKEQVWRQTTNEHFLSISDARLARELQRDPSIAALRKPDGSFDFERYTAYAASRGLSTQALEARLRQSVVLNQLETSVSGTALGSKALGDVALNAFFERREIQLVRFDASDFASKVQVSDADIQAYYDANAARFQAPESADIEYVVLDLEAIQRGIVLNDQDVKTYYEQNAQRLSGKEERRASHILITAAKAAAPAEREKAKARAQELLAEVRKAPERFADLARKNSQDPGSAANGGDLEFFGRGAMVKPFEDAVFAMRKGDISEVVETDFGYHIIRLTDIKAPPQRSFQELKPEIEKDLKTQQAQRKFAEVAETFTNAVYEQADGLQGVADKLKLERKTANGLRRTPAPGAQGVLANAKFLEALFSPDSLQNKRNTEAIEWGSSRLVSGRIVQYAPARTLPLDEVRPAVRQALLAARAGELARKEGQEKLAAWKTAGAVAARQIETLTVSRADASPKIIPPVQDAVLRADATTLPAWVGVDLGAQGYAIAKVQKVLPRTQPDAATAAQEAQSLQQAIANAEAQAYYAWLRQRQKAEIKIARPGAAETGATP